MNPHILGFLSDMIRDIFTIAGVGYIPLVVLLVFRAGRLRNLNEENMAERLGDLCFDTIKELIKDKIEELLQIYYNQKLIMPPGRGYFCTNFFLALTSSLKMRKGYLI